MPSSSKSFPGRKVYTRTGEIDNFAVYVVSDTLDRGSSPAHRARIVFLFMACQECYGVQREFHGHERVRVQVNT